MSLLDDLGSRILKALTDEITKLLAPITGPLINLCEILKGCFTAIAEVVPETITLVTGIYHQVFAWKDFKQNISFKHGVINLQSAREKIEDTIQQLITAWHSLTDLFTSGFKISVRPITEAAETMEELVSGFETLGKIGLKDWFSKIGDLFEKVGGKVFEVLAVIQSVAEELLRVVRELQSILDLITNIRETAQTGEGLFLKQTNPRKRLNLDRGGSINIRVGNLHES